MPPLQPTIRFFSLIDLLYVGFAPVGHILDIKGDKKHFTFVGKNGTSRIDLFLTWKLDGSFIDLFLIFFW